MAEGNVVAVVIFAAFIGNSMKILNKKYSDVIQPVTDLVNASYKIITSLAMTVIKFMPYAVVALLANTIAGRGISAIKEVVGFILALYVSIIIVFIIHLIIIRSEEHTSELQSRLHLVCRLLLEKRPLRLTMPYSVTR